MIKKAEAGGLLSGFEIGSSIQISHLLSDDNNLLFCAADAEQLRTEHL